MKSFADLTRAVSSAAGSWQASLAAFLIVATWIAGGFYFGFSDTLYQLIINSFTTVVTFLMVFLIQSSTNRSEKSIQIKLNEIIFALEKADNRLISLEEDSDQHIEAEREKMSERKKEGR